VFQFAEAQLVGPDSYEVSRRLRGQGGTDPLIPAAWPAGSRFVVLNAALRQINLPAALRGIERHYRIGPAAIPFDDSSYVEEARAFAGVGLRPYAPVHLRAARTAHGDLRVTWIRRTRIDGDLWSDIEVPLGEASEVYLVRVRVDGAIRRQAQVPAPVWVYQMTEQAADAVSGPFQIEVAQMSDRFGPGLFRRISIND
jgi:hypothetical protein